MEELHCPECSSKLFTVYRTYTWKCSCAYCGHQWVYPLSETKTDEQIKYDDLMLWKRHFQFKSNVRGTIIKNALDEIIKLRKENEELKERLKN